MMGASRPISGSTRRSCGVPSGGSSVSQISTAYAPITGSQCSVTTASAGAPASSPVTRTHAFVRGPSRRPNSRACSTRRMPEYSIRSIGQSLLPPRYTSPLMAVPSAEPRTSAT